MKKSILFSIFLSSFLLMNFKMNYTSTEETNVTIPVRKLSKNFNGQELTIYNCADYIDEELIENFQEEYNCKINY